MTILVQAATYLMFRASQARRIHTLHTGSGIGCGGDGRDGRGTVHGGSEGGEGEGAGGVDGIQLAHLTVMQGERC